MANFFENAGSVLTAASEGAQDPGAAAERQAKQQAAVVGAAQMVLQNPNATEEQVKAASVAMEKNGFDPIMVQGLRPGPAGPQLKTVGARERLVSIPPGGGAPTELVPAIPGAGGGRGVTSSELFQQNRARWLGLREKERTGNLSAKEKDEMDITFRKLTSQPNVMNMVMESALTGQPMGSISQPPQPTQTTGPQLTETQQGWIDNGRNAIAGGKDEEGVIEKIRQQTGLTREEIRSRL